jgi:RNA polymerase sigma-70 factor (ECF subfamily)
LKVLAENESGYDSLYHSHRARVLGLCRLLLADRDEAEDVSQEVLIKLYRAQRSISEPIAWGPWLTRVTVNACRDRRRSGWWRWWRDGHRELEAENLRGNTRTPEEDAIGREQREAIWESFHALSSRQREVFVLRYVEELPTNDVAEALGMSAGTVKRHLYRAVHRLRGALGSRS